jgi:hypothetical protein
MSLCGSARAALYIEAFIVSSKSPIITVYDLSYSYHVWFLLERTHQLLNRSNL